jgi:DNA-binding FadR family transcriptional regulator
MTSDVCGPGIPLDDLWEGNVIDNPAVSRRELLHDSTQDRVKQFIIDHGLRAGDPLPPEAELARQLGISRPSMREAMRALQTMGVVETRHGVGTFVGHFSFDSFTDGLAFQIDIGRQDDRGMARDLHELVAIREVLESALVARLAGTYSANEIAALYDLTAEMERLAAEGEMFAEEDWRFHELLYRNSGNRLLIRLLESFWTVCDRVRQSKPSPEYLQTTARHHRELVNALAAGDSAGSAKAMTVHFWGIMQWFDEQGQNNNLLGMPDTTEAGTTR